MSVLFFQVPFQKTFLSTNRLTTEIFRLVCMGLLFAGTGACAQTLQEMQSQFLLGNYAKVITTAQKEVDDNSYLTDWRMLLVKSLLTAGRYGDAYTNAMRGLDNYSSNIGLRLLAREAALYQNDLA